MTTLSYRDNLGDRDVIQVEEVDSSTRLRAVLVADYYPEPPDGDFGSPLLRLDQHGSVDVVPGTLLTGYTVAPGIIEAAERWGFDDERNFERYCRVFHGVRTFVHYSDGQGHTFVTFDPLDWRVAVGSTPDSPPESCTPDLSDLRAYCEGEVYGVMIQRYTGEEDERGDDEGQDGWTEVDSCWGFYGHSYAEEEARSMLAYAVADEPARVEAEHKAKAETDAEILAHDHAGIHAVPGDVIDPDDDRVPPTVSLLMYGGRLVGYLTPDEADGLAAQLRTAARIVRETGGNA